MYNKKKSSLTFLYILIFVITFCPIIGAWFPFFARTWIFYLLGSLISVLLIPQFYSSRIFFALLVYSIIVLLKALIGNSYFSSTSMAISSSVEMIFAISVMFYLVKYRDEELMGRFVLATLAILTVLTVGTYLAENFYPGAVRYVAHLVSTGEMDALGVTLMRFGMTNYSLPHALPILIPPLIGGLKNKQLKIKYKVLCAAILTACMAIIFLAGAATPVMLSIALFVLSFFIKPTRKQNTTFMVFLFFVAIIIVFRQEFGQLLVSIGGDSQSEGAGFSISTRVSEIGNYLVTGEEGEDLEGRSGHYDTTISSLFENVIWGTDKVGGHSAILDRFALLGIVGFTPWIVAIIMSLKKLYRIFKGRKGLPFFTAGVMSAVIMMMAKNMASFAMWFTLFVLLPVFMRFCDADERFRVFGEKSRF